MANIKSEGWRRSRWAGRVLCLLALLAGELALSTRQQSQTFDEACHIFAGYRSWKNFDFGINPEHPPLVKLVAAIPLLSMPLKVPAVPQDYFKFVEYTGGREFLYANDVDSLLFRARMAAGIFTIFLALTVFLVARSMWGDGPAYLALVLLIFDPNILAHGALVTTDMGVTFGLFLAAGCFYFYRKMPSGFRLLCAGLATGVCLGTKHSGILIFPMLLLLAITELLPIRDPSTKRITPDLGKKALGQIFSLAAVTAISLVVLWSFYGFRYSARAPGLAVNPPLSEFAGRMGPVSSAIVLQIARWHLLPESYLYGVVDVYSPAVIPTFLFGKVYPAGQWFYFPAIFLIKSTVAFLLLCCLVPLTRALREAKFRREVFFLVIPPAVYFCAALFSGINYGVRHLLPVYPFLIVLAAFCAWNLAQRHRAAAIFVTIALIFHIASSVRAFPNYISYANELWGGPQNAHRILADSNVDWGQGLKAMKRYIDDRQIKNCWFAYFGSVVADAAYYGIPCKALPASFANAVQLQMPAIPQSVDGPVFLSASEIAGTYWGADWENPYLSFRNAPPSAVIANSILVFDGKVDLSSAAALTHEQSSAWLLQAKQFEQALAEADSAVAIAPNTPGAHATRGNVLAAMNRKTEALAEFDQAQKLGDAIMAPR
ncbi:MAG: phospholipid carrier-dependent glycosyltransferase [Acidobacteriia bacterium]|nr:phospholipid carrier-dependent glycosyltransferase [Terriglobia bacterium]